MGRRRDMSNIAIDIGRDGVAAVKIRRGATTIITNTMLLRRPADVPLDKPEVFGRWLGEALTASGIGCGRAAFVLDRNAVSIRQFELPSADSNELVGMVRIALERDLPIDTEDAVIDFSILEENDGVTRVQAIAVPRAELERIQAIAHAAGVKVGAVTLRCLGATEMVQRTFSGDDGVLVVDVTSDSLEVALSRRGELLFSRGIQLNEEDRDPTTIEQLTVEVRRSWLSYRVAGGEAEAPVAVVVGGEDTGRLVEEIAEATGLETVAFAGDRSCRAHGKMSGIWPLVGALSNERESINLAAPREAVSRSVRNRQQALATLGAVIIATGIGWSIGERQFATLQATADDLGSQANSALAGHLRFKRDGFLLSHLEAWRGVRPDWLEHMLVVVPQSSSPQNVVLKDFMGSIDVPQTLMDRSGTWTTRALVQLAVEGEADSRATAFELRDQFVADPRYALRTGGADQAGGSMLAFPFRYSLRSEVLEPNKPGLEGGEE